MSVLGRIFGRPGPARRSSLEDPRIPLSQADDLLFEALGADRSRTGLRTSVRGSLALGPVYRAASKIAGDVAALPVFVYRNQATGRTKERAHEVSWLLREQPNEYQDAFQFRKTLQSHAVTQGNGYAAIERDRLGRPRALLLLDPSRVTPVREKGTLWYVLSTEGGAAMKLPPEDVLHVMGLSLDGLVGLSVIALARESISLGLATQAYGAVFFRNAATPKVVLEHPGALSEEAATRLRQSWERLHTGLDMAHRTAILEEGMSAKPLSLSAEDSQFLETREFQIREIATWFGVPAHFLGDTTRTSYNSLEQENLAYLVGSLNPWLVSWEVQLRRKLFSEDERRADTYAVEFYRRALMSADAEKRAKANALGVQWGWLSRDEVREEEGYNPIPDGSGSKFLVPLNMTPSDQLGEEKDPPEDKPPANPDDPPMPPKDDMDEMPVRAAVRRSLEAEAARLARRVARSAERAAKHPDRFLDELRGWDDAHGAAFLEALAPHLEVVAAVRGTGGLSAGDHAEWSLRWFKQWAATHAARAKVGDLEAEVSTWAPLMATQFAGALVGRLGMEE